MSYIQRNCGRRKQTGTVPDIVFLSDEGTEDILDQLGAIFFTLLNEPHVYYPRHPTYITPSTMTWLTSSILVTNPSPNGNSMQSLPNVVSGVRPAPTGSPRRCHPSLV